MCEYKNIFGKYFAESIFSPKMLEYFFTMEQDEITPNDFDPSTTKERLYRTKLLFHGHIIRLVDNMHIRTIFNLEEHLDLVYCVQNEVLKSYNQIQAEEKSSVPKSLIAKLKEFVVTYLRQI